MSWALIACLLRIHGIAHAVQPPRLLAMTILKCDVKVTVQRIRQSTVKVKVCLCTPYMRAYRGSGGVAHPIHSLPCLLPGKNFGILWIGGWVGPRARQDLLEKREISYRNRDLNPDSPDRSRVVVRTTPTEFPESPIIWVIFVCNKFVLK